VTSSETGDRSASQSSSATSSSSHAAAGPVSESSSSEDLFDDQQKNCEEIRTSAAAASDQQRDERVTTTTTNQHRPPTSTCQSSAIEHGYSRGHEAASRVTAAHVSTFQITPTLRQRAFPRTNPAYVGTYRRDRPPTYRRLTVDSQPAVATSFGIASELRPTRSPVTLQRPNSDGLQRALIQHSGDVYSQPRRTGHQCPTVVSHQRMTDHAAPQCGVVVRPQSEGASSALRVANCRYDTASRCDMRRQSEPDYVNVMTRHQSHQSHQPSAGHVVDDSRWTSQLVPSAIYMNQHELTIAGRYTSRSTCNFMDTTANGIRH